MPTIKIHNPNDLPTIDHKKLKSLQGDFKTLSADNQDKLINSILNHGFFVPIFLWKKVKTQLEIGEDTNNWEYYIVDAHQRCKVLKQLEQSGYTIPTVPYVEIQADDEKDAATKLLQINSRYGELNKDTEFFDKFNIQLDIFGEVALPELEYAKELEKYKKQKFDDIIDKFTIIKGQANQNENWFYVEYYQQDDIFAQLTDVFKNHFVGRSKHEIDSNLFLNMVLSYVNQCNMEVTEDEI